MTGFAIRNNFIQKMAPGDRSFHATNWDEKTKQNKVKSFASREEAEKWFTNLGAVPKILVSGESGDVLESEGD
jgi:hypothetical protein